MYRSTCSLDCGKPGLFVVCSDSQFLTKLANAALSDGGPLSDMTLCGITWRGKMDFMATITGPAFVLLSRTTSGNLEQ